MLFKHLDNFFKDILFENQAGAENAYVSSTSMLLG